ncbi:S-layer homology domain-containing protein [Paenibacillus kobensis]|uniref:S-layer homology domain-containing protein n=1 Tax=Paenibacillus kobensis TaxID=59841 RepID=UPI000FDCB038|nr:S-layer homology domain-containing protein [Paenibacillus kobensis]
MVYRSKSFKASAWLLAMSLVAGGTVSAQTAVPYDSTAVASTAGTVSVKASTPFTDVKAGHWAEKHIAKLALQNIILGNNGQFRPADSVSRQEAIVMAIRFAGLESEVNRDEAVVFPTSFQVDKYFTPYVVLAFEKGLINQNEQFGIADKETGTAWGSSKASREWVTKLIVNAIGKSADAKASASKPLTFADAANVGEGYGGYINTAVSLNLVNGVAGNKFDPKGAVNRAMMATLLSRAESQFTVQYAGQTEGILTSSGSGTITLHTSAGPQTYTTSSDTLYSHTGSEQFMADSSLIPYARVFVIAKDGKALYVEQVNDEQKVETISGTFDRFVAASHKMWIWVGDTPTEIVYDDTLQMKDKDGKTIAASALTKDSNVKVVRDTFRTSPIAISVQVVDSPNAPVNKTGSGTVKSVGVSAITVTLADGTDETWNVATDAIFISGTTVLKSLQDIKTGDKVSYVVKDNAVSRVEVSGGAVKLSDSGTFFNSDKNTLTYIKDKKYVTKPVAAAAVINIEGLPSATLTDLQENDQLELTLNESDQVTLVKVTNRKVEMAAGVEIRSYDSKDKRLYVVDGKGQPHLLQFNANSQIETNGVSLTLEAALSGGMLNNGRKITVSYTGDVVVKIQLSYRYTGTFVSVDTANSKLTMSVGGNLLTLGMQSPVVDLYGKSSGSLADLQNGNEIIAVMNQEQDKVNVIQVVSKRQLKVAAVNASSSRVTLADGSGTIDYSASGIDVLDDAGGKLALGSLPVGSVVNVTFNGSSLARIQRVAVTIGAVRAIDSTNIVMTDYNGVTAAFPLSSKYTIIRNGVSSNTYTALQAGDRVEIRKDADGNYVATVLKSEQKKFSKYDAATNTLQTMRAVITDKFQYSLNGVALTSGGAVITPQSIEKESALVLYYYDDKLIEIEKK